MAEKQQRLTATATPVSGNSGTESPTFPLSGEKIKRQKFQLGLCT